MKKIIQFTLLASLTFVFQSCNGEGFEKKVSVNGSTESHNAGENCMACHTSGGAGESSFQVAGTVYNELFTTIYANANINLYTGAAGTGELKYTIEGDAKGNFYTTEKIKFDTPLYPAVTGTGGTKYMSTTITTGNCMSCHGNSTNKIWVN